AQTDGRKRRLLRRLEHHGAARRQRRPELGRGHRQREVPRHDLPDHADRLAQHVAEPLARRRNLVGLALDLGRPAGLIAQLADRPAFVGNPGELDRPAGSRRLGRRQFLAVGSDQVGERVEQPRPLVRLHLAPRPLERGARRSDSGIDVRLPATGDIGQLFAGGRVLGRERLAALRLAPLAADQHLADFAAPALAEGFEAGLDRGLGIHDGLSTTFGGLLSARSRRIKIVSDTYHMSRGRRTLQGDFDYVIVGAGLAGRWHAGRLTEDLSAHVLLLDAGGWAAKFLIRMPLGMMKAMLKPELTWRIMTEPEPTLIGRRLFLPRGRLLGGSSSINGMVYMRGHSADYDRGAQEGARGWSHAEARTHLR